MGHYEGLVWDEREVNNLKFEMNDKQINQFLAFPLIHVCPSSWAGLKLDSFSV